MVAVEGAIRADGTAGWEQGAYPHQASWALLADWAAKLPP